MVLKNQEGELPDGTTFWKETQLGQRLRDVSKVYNNKYEKGHESLRDILDFLEGKVWGEYYSFNTSKIRLSITEVPNFD